jgi:hypothetical protein
MSPGLSLTTTLTCTSGQLPSITSSTDALNHTTTYGYDSLEPLTK